MDCFAYTVLAVGAFGRICSFDSVENDVERDVSRSELSEDAGLVSAKLINGVEIVV